MQISCVEVDPTTSEVEQAVLILNKVTFVWNVNWAPALWSKTTDRLKPKNNDREHVVLARPAISHDQKIAQLINE